jgi:hypothetical protein
MRLDAFAVAEKKFLENLLCFTRVVSAHGTGSEFDSRFGEVRVELRYTTEGIFGLRALPAST